MSERILVTGASGFVGQHLVKRLVEEGHEVTALDIRQSPPEMFREHVGDSVTYISGSILHEEFVRTEVFPAPNMYDRVFHLAAIVGVNRYVDPDDPLYIADVNLNGTKLLLELVRGSDTRFVYTSTSELYGRNPDTPWEESDDRVLGPVSQSRWSYSSMKATCEHMIHMQAETDPALSATIVRPFNLYGPEQRPNFVIPKFLHMAANGEVPTVYGDGTQTRCFTYIDDFIEGILRASNRLHDDVEVYNLGSTDEIQIDALANHVLTITGMEDEEPIYVDREDEHGSDYKEPPKRVPDVSAAKERLDWRANTPLIEGLKRTYQHIK